MKGVLLFGGCYLLVSCSQPDRRHHDPPHKEGVGESIEAPPAPKKETRFLHSISVRLKGGLVLSYAALTDSTGKLLHPKNIIRTGETIYLNLAVQKGWSVKNGYVSIGAIQSITTHNGEPVLQSGDLFGNRQIAEQQSKILRLRSVITRSRPDIPFYVVRFRIWDKNGAGEAKGHFRLYVESH